MHPGSSDCNTKFSRCRSNTVDLTGRKTAHSARAARARVFVKFVNIRKNHTVELLVPGQISARIRDPEQILVYDFQNFRNRKVLGDDQELF
jgi:hypothetical protein